MYPCDDAVPAASGRRFSTQLKPPIWIPAGCLLRSALKRCSAYAEIHASRRCIANPSVSCILSSRSPGVKAASTSIAKAISLTCRPRDVGRYFSVPGTFVPKGAAATVRKARGCTAHWSRRTIISSSLGDLRRQPWRFAPHHTLIRTQRVSGFDIDVSGYAREGKENRVIRFALQCAAQDPGRICQARHVLFECVQLTHACRTR